MLAEAALMYPNTAFCQDRSQVPVVVLFWVFIVKLLRTMTLKDIILVGVV